MHMSYHCEHCHKTHPDGLSCGQATAQVTITWGQDGSMAAGAKTHDLSYEQLERLAITISRSQVRLDKILRYIIWNQ